jgi:hypothetical protein
MFVIVSVIIIPLVVCGFFLSPGTFDIPNKLSLSDTETAFARKRFLNNVDPDAELEEPGKKYFFALLKATFTDMRSYVLMLRDTLFWNPMAGSMGRFLFWLDSLNRYPISRLNALSAIASGLAVFFVLFVNFSSDLVLGLAGAITITTVVNLVSYTMLAVWKVPE